MTWKNPFHYTKEERELSDAYIRRKNTVKHLLTPHQKKLHALIFDSPEREIGYYCSRKVGKTASILLCFYEFAWKNPGCLIRFVLADQTQATSIIEPMISSFINRLLPSDLLPRYYKTERALKFRNGSIIKLNGANPDSIDKAVGPSCDLFGFDEIAIWEGDVKYALFDVFYPQATLTNAKKIFSCTPPPNVDAYYITNIHPKLVARNTLISLTIYENPLVTPRDIEQIEEQMGGKDSPEFRRQYMCELIPSNSRRLTPEFDEDIHVYEERAKAIEYGDGFIPQFYQYYICNDTGTVDNNAVLVGYLDHHNQQLVIEEESVRNNVNLTEIAQELKEFKDKYMEYAYHPDKGMKTIIDAFTLERKELREIHGIQHVSPIKGKVEDNIAHLRSALQNNKIQISFKCERLIWELKNCVWKISTSDNKQIERNEEQKHGDAIMALTYMLRAVNWRFRPDKPEHNLSLIEYSPKKNSVKDMKERTPLLWGDLIKRKFG